MSHKPAISPELKRGIVGSAIAHGVIGVALLVGISVRLPEDKKQVEVELAAETGTQADAPMKADAPGPVPAAAVAPPPAAPAQPAQPAQ